jgi:hypothetical protein
MRVWIVLKSWEHAESLKKSMCYTENPPKSATENPEVFPIEEICELVIRHSRLICIRVHLSPIQNLQEALHMSRECIL